MVWTNMLPPLAKGSTPQAASARFSRTHVRPIRYLVTYPHTRICCPWLHAPCLSFLLYSWKLLGKCRLQPACCLCMLPFKSHDLPYKYIIYSTVYYTVITLFNRSARCADLPFQSHESPDDQGPLLVTLAFSYQLVASCRGNYGNWIH